MGPRYLPPFFFLANSRPETCVMFTNDKLQDDRFDGKVHTVWHGELWLTARPQQNAEEFAIEEATCHGVGVMIYPDQS